MNASNNRCYEFGPFVLDERERLLLRDGQAITLPPKAFETLLLLVENGGHVLTKEEMLTRLWPDTFVEEANLTNNISLLRKALGEDSEGQQYIKTVQRVGYRFVAVVKQAQEGQNLALAPDKPGAVTHSAAGIVLPSAHQRFKLVSGLIVGSLLMAGLIGGVLLLRQRPSTTSGIEPGTIHSLAVLPLANLSGDPGQDYFADGMTEAVITELAKISALRVISRASIIQYKETRKTMPEIARELNVDAVIAGSVQRSGDRVRITVQLIHAPTDRHLWANDYERDVRDILGLQSELGRAIAHQVKVKLTPQEQSLVATSRPVNAEAHDAYLKGLYYFNQGINERSEEPMKKSSEYFQQAINLDPSYAPAHAGLSRSYHWVASWEIRSRELYPKAKAAALKALELDETLAEAHISLGYILFHYDWDWAGCEREYKRAFELNSTERYHAYGLYLSAAGRHDEAIANIKQAEEIDPLTLPIKRNVGLVLIRARRYDEAIQQYQKVLELKPDAPVPLWGLARAYALKGRHAEAVAAIQRSLQISGDDPKTDADLAWFYAWSGRKDEARKILAELETTPDKASRQRISLAAVYTALGEKDKAFTWLDRAYENHSQALLYLNVWPEFDNLRSDPRFVDLLKRVGLKP